MATRPTRRKKPASGNDAPIVIGPREQLFHRLSEAAEIEHTLMCSYLYAAFLKCGRGIGLSSIEARMVASWRNRRMLTHLDYRKPGRAPDPLNECFFRRSLIEGDAVVRAFCRQCHRRLHQKISSKTLPRHLVREGRGRTQIAIARLLALRSSFGLRDAANIHCRETDLQNDQCICVGIHTPRDPQTIAC
jgi:hypothetical protein